jgi:HK97 family phage prohead protease
VKKSFVTEFKVDGAKNQIEAYASIFDHVDAGKDRVKQGAFVKTLREDASRKHSRIKALWQHDAWSPVGIPAEIHEDSKGLYTLTKISKTTLGKDLMILVEDGVVNELSIGFNTVKDAWDDNTGIRDLVELKLWEYSYVTWGMNDLASVEGTKSIEDLWRYVDIVFDVQQAVKAGRVLSKKDMAAVKSAIDALSALLVTPEPPQGTQKGDGEPPIDNLDEPGDHLDEIKALAESLEIEATLRSISRSL